MSVAARHHSTTSAYTNHSPNGHVESTSQPTPDGPSSPKRRKVTRACDHCKTRKRRCTGEIPCPTCAEHGLQCTYLSSYTRGNVPEPRPAGDSREAPPKLGTPRTSHGAATGDPPEKSLGAPRAMTSTARTSRTGSPIGDGIVPASGQYVGPTSPFAFLRRAWRRFGRVEPHHPDHALSQQDVSIYSYGDRRVPSLDTGNFQMPDRETTAMLVARYFEFAMPTYRFLHRPTLCSWLQSYYEQKENTLSPARQAVVLMVLAAASLYAVDASHTVISASALSEEAWQAGETFYQAAQLQLQAESGRICLESVQARLAMALYLLNTSRLNQAWYILGTTVQLLTALGLHRSRVSTSSPPDAVLKECRKRSFWAAYVLDAYMSVMLGRPPMIHDDDVDQQYPELANDEDITSGGIKAHSMPRDCVEAASVLHAKLIRIVKQACKEQYSTHRPRGQHQVQTAKRLNSEILQWRERLPVFLSGAIHPSSLIPVFRRQLTVLRIASAHALMLINRPLILDRDTPPANVQPLVDKCLSAAQDVLDLVLDFVSEQHMFPAFWYTQYVAFNALSAVYVWIIQKQHGKLANVQSQHDETRLFELAEAVQSHLGTATRLNAPSLRYSITLEELQQETKRLLGRAEPAPAMDDSSLSTGSMVQFQDNEEPQLDWDVLSADFPGDGDLWNQLDSLLFGNNEM